MTTQTNGNNLVVQGRIVWGIGKTLFEGKQKTDYNTNAPVFGQDGNPVVEYGFGLAIPKVDPATNQPTEEFNKVWTTLHNEAFTLYPSGQLPPGFAMKFKDGDGIDHQGKPYADKEGYAGHIILACTTQIPIKYFRFENGNNVLVNTGIKSGDYVNVQLNVKAHPAKGQGKPGLYLNPSAVQLIQEGKEIITTPSGDQIFGQTMPGYSGQVVAPTQPTMPGQAPAAPAQPGTPGQQPLAPAAPAPVAPNPHYGVIPQTHQPAPTQTGMPGQPLAPMGNGVPPVQPGQTPYTAPPVNAGYVPPASPSNGVPAMPGMPGAR